MFEAFWPYELQVIHDWIRGPSTRPVGAPPMPRENEGLLDLDLRAFNETWPDLDASGKHDLLVHLMAPALHWTPAGLAATRLLLARVPTLGTKAARGFNRFGGGVGRAWRFPASERSGEELQILAIATGITAPCALQPIPIRGPPRRADAFARMRAIRPTNLQRKKLRPPESASRA